MDCSVLVVGAGPVGLTLAIELARFGVGVRIVDKAAQRTDKSKALVLWPRSVELLDRAGCGQRFVAAGLKGTAMTIVAGSRQIAHVGFDSVESPHPYALMIPQSRTEALLEETLAGLGVTVERGVDATRLAPDATGVGATLRHPDGRDETIEAAWLVGCDGAHSVVRHALGMDFIGDTLPTDWILADIHIKGAQWPASEMAMFWHEDGVLIFFPMEGGHYRVIADVGKTDAAHPRTDPSLAEVQALVDRRGQGGLDVFDPVWLSVFRINERKVASYRSGRVFLAGDAAHIHSPAGGQGMNTGMQDAFNLAWKLAMVSRGTCAPEPLLDSYSAERSPVGAQVIAATGRLTGMAVLTNPVAQAIRNTVASLVFGLAPIRKGMIDTLAEVSIGYPDGPLTRAAARGTGHPGPGERAPPRADELPAGSGSRPAFALFAESAEAAADLQSRFPDLLDEEVRKPYDDGAIRLVRPDGYVAMVAPRDGWDEIADYLESLGRGQPSTFSRDTISTPKPDNPT